MGTKIPAVAMKKTKKIWIPVAHGLLQQTLAKLIFFTSKTMGGASSDRDVIGVVNRPDSGEEMVPWFLIKQILAKMLIALRREIDISR